jgi:hypothetical protein
VNFSDAIEELDVSRMITEDILRVLGERKEKASLRFLEGRIRVS